MLLSKATYKRGSSIWIYKLPVHILESVKFNVNIELILVCICHAFSHVLILYPWFLEKNPEIKPFSESLVDATIRVYSTITSALLPTPAKSHYTFNLRDLSKVFQGILMAEAGKIEVPPLINLSSSDISCFIYLLKIFCVIFVYTE